MYGIYPEADKPDDYDEENASWRSDEYTDNIEGSWSVYNPDKHDGFSCGEPDFYQIN